MEKRLGDQARRRRLVAFGLSRLAPHSAGEWVEAVGTFRAYDWKNRPKCAILLHAGRFPALITRGATSAVRRG